MKRKFVMFALLWNFFGESFPLRIAVLQCVLLVSNFCFFEPRVVVYLLNEESTWRQVSCSYVQVYMYIEVRCVDCAKIALKMDALKFSVDIYDFDSINPNIRNVAINISVRVQCNPFEANIVFLALVYFI